MITEKLRAGLRVIFIGFNPSLTSHEKGFNYAGRSNRFYKVLYAAGLTNRVYKPEESFSLLDEYSYGFTNIVTRPTRQASELTREEYRQGAIDLQDKLARYQPAVACFVGKGVYQAFVGHARPVPWGMQSPILSGQIAVFVGPATSGLVRMTLAELADHYRPLTAYLTGTKA